MIDLAPFKLFADSNDWFEVWPELALALGAVLVLGLELFRSKELGRRSFAGPIAIFFQASLLVFHLIDYLIWHHPFDHETFSGLLGQSSRGEVMRSFFLLASLLVSILGESYLRRRKLAGGEFHHLTMLATAGLMLLVQSNHFLMLFVALETVAICFYVLVAYQRDSAKSLEAGLKYLVFGALSSSLLLFGIVLLYGVAVNPEAWGCVPVGVGLDDPLEFGYLSYFLEANSDNLILRAGVILIISGIAFKIGAAPFQIWVPDVYHGSPMPITAFLAVSSKAAGFFVLLNLVNGPFEGMSDFLLPILGFIATLTILFGNLAACAQRNLKRLLGLSGVAHAGYLLVGVIAAMLSQTMQADWVITFYLFTYLLGSFAVFGVMSLANVPDDAEHEFSHYEGLGQKNPFLAFVLSCGVCSLAGVPPFAGFIAKLLLFVVAFKAKLYFSLAVMVVGVVISIYYYFGWLREALFIPRPKFPDEEDGEPDPWDGLKLGGILKLTLVILTAATLVLGIWQGAFGDAF